MRRSITSRSIVPGRGISLILACGHVKQLSSGGGGIRTLRRVECAECDGLRRTTSWALEVRHRDGRRLQFWPDLKRRDMLKKLKEVAEIGLVRPNFAARDLVLLAGHTSNFASLVAEPLWVEATPSADDIRRTEIHEVYASEVGRGHGYVNNSVE